MITNGTIQYKIEQEVEYDINHNPIVTSSVYSECIPCNIRLIQTNTAIYVGGEQHNITLSIIIENRYLKDVDFLNISQLLVTKQGNPSVLQNVVYVDSLPLTKNIRFYL